MRILLLHNHYGSHSGESAVLDVHKKLLIKNGHSVYTYTRSSVELESMHLAKICAFFTSLYNPFSIRKLKNIISEFRPDIVHVHNLYPLLSPSVLPVIRKMQLPIVMTVHNYRLICPNGLFYNMHGICERCSGGKEWNCVRFNCESSFLKSLGYALRNMWSRLCGYYMNSVDAYLCLTEFQKMKLVQNGYLNERCHVLPNFINESPLSMSSVDTDNSILFIGRLNNQKGIDFLIEIARQCKDKHFVIAGPNDTGYLNENVLPENITYVGVVDEDEKTRLLKLCKMLLFTSRSYEGFPVVFLEAMMHGVPVIAPKLAGYPEIIKEGMTGELYISGNIDDVIEKIDIVFRKTKSDNIYFDNCINTINDKYTSNVWYEKYEKIINALVKQ